MEEKSHLFSGLFSRKLEGKMALRFDKVIDVSTRLIGDDAPSLMIEMEYMSTLSVNRYKTANGITRSEVQDWMQQLAKIISMSVNSVNLRFEPPIKIRLGAVFADRRHPDMDNLLKVVGDSVAMGLQINDKLFQYQTETPEVGGYARLIITIGNAT